MNTIKQKDHEECQNGHRLQLITKAITKAHSFTCNGCKELGSGHRYRCDTCNFDLHKKCHKPPLTTKSQHFHPQHTFEFLLRLPPTTNPPCVCVACGKPISGFLYHCKDYPKWFLHPCCTNLDLVLKLPCIKDADEDFFLQDQDAAAHYDLGSKPCLHCKKIEDFPGWSYVSTFGVYRYHVSCSMEIARQQQQQHQITTFMDTEQGRGQGCSGGHQLKLVKRSMNVRNSKSYFKCDGCKEKGYGPSYCCDICNFDLHKECHDYKPSLTVQGPEGHMTFDFLRHLPSPAKSGPSSCCHACGKSVRGFVYHCKERGWNFHPCCTNLYHKIHFTKSKIDLFLQRNEISKTKACSRCKKTILTLSGGTNEGVPGWSYASKCGAYRYHVYCMMEEVPEIRCRGLLEIAAGLKAAQASLSKGGGGRTNTRDDDDFWLDVLSNLSSGVLQLTTGLDPTSFLIDILLK